MPGRAWSGGEPVSAENLQGEDDPLCEAAAEAGFRGAIAFPVLEGGLAGVFELFRAEELVFDEGLLQTTALLGQQISQFVERRRADEVARIAAERDRFRIKLSDALRSLTDPGEIQAKAARVLGEYLGVSRVHYAEIADDDAHVAVGRDYTDGVPRLTGRFRLDDFGAALIGALRDGRTLVVPDIAGSPDLSAAERAAYAGVAVGAQVGIPLVKEGRLAALLAVHQAEARVWTPGEIALIEETAERTWAAVERARAEKALRESEAKYRALFDSIDEGFCTIEVLFDKDEKPVDYRFLQVSPSFVWQTGIDNAAGRRMREIAPQHEEHWFETYGKIAETGESVRFQNRAEQLGRWYDVYAFRVEDPQLRRVGILFNDITERKEAEEALRENEEWLGLAQQAARSGTWEWNLRGGEIRWSTEHRELFGFDAEESVTRERWWAVVHPDDLPAIEEAGRRCSEQGEEWPDIEYRISPRNGAGVADTRWISSRGRTVRDDDGRPARILGISADVTERRKAEEERDRLLAREWMARAQVEERRRLSRELHDRVAHDIAVVHQSLELHETLKTDEPAKALAKMELARERVKAALHTTRNLSMELRQPEVRQGLEAALSNLLRDVVPPTVVSRLIVVGDEESMPFELRDQLFVILREAVRNAVAHSGCGEIVVDLSIAPEKVVACVEDDGRGFDVATTRTRGGIKSMRERAALAGADFEISSSRGAGTRVTVSAPLEEV